MASETREGLREQFGAAVDDDDLMEECVQMCTLFNLKPDDLFFKWEAFSYSSSLKDRVISGLDLGGARELHNHLRRQQASEASASVSTPTNVRVKTLPKSITRNILGGSSSKTPSSPLATPRQPVRPTTAPVPATLVHRPKAKYTPPDAIAEYEYRYMYEKMSERSEVLDELVDEMAERIKEFYHLDDIGDPASMTEEEVVVVGRICSDSEEKPNESSLLLESSRILGSGKRVSLQFQPQCILRSELPGRPSFNFFSGQLVALRGKNGNGLKFVVAEILAPPRLLPQPRTERPDFLDSEPTLIFTACGPFSSERDLDYGPWTKLMAAVEKAQPSVLILLGPFVDISNSLIKRGAVTQTPLAYFQQHIASELESLFGSIPGISVFLVPSPRDIIHDHFAFPQRPFNREQLGLSPNVVLLPNPCTININGVNIAVSSIDTTSQIGAQQQMKHIRDVPDALDGVQLMWLQILEQRSFYPLFPVPYKESPNVNLDITHSHLLRLDTAPDVMIIPSRLKTTSRIVDRTVMINPGYLTRGANADSYAKILLPSLGSVKTLEVPAVASIDGAPRDQENSAGERTDLPERTKVEILKLE